MLHGPSEDPLLHRCDPVLRELPNALCIPVPFGGLKQGDSVVYLGQPKLYPSGDALKRRHIGRVLNEVNGDSVKVSFQGHKGKQDIEKTLLGWNPLPGGFSVGDLVKYSGPPVLYASGDSLRLEHSGRITGSATNFKTELIEVIFEGHTKKTDIEHAALTRPHIATPANRRKRCNELNGALQLSISSKRCCRHQATVSSTG